MDGRDSSYRHAATNNGERNSTVQQIQSILSKEEGHVTSGERREAIRKKISERISADEFISKDLQSDMAYYRWLYSAIIHNDPIVEKAFRTSDSLIVHKLLLSLYPQKSDELLQKFLSTKNDEFKDAFGSPSHHPPPQALSHHDAHPHPRAQNTQRNNSISQPLRNIVLVGNPGAGKSTLLNTMAEVPSFRSGPAFSDSDKFGMTKEAKSVFIQRRGALLTDTPGLSEVAAVKRNLEELQKGLDAHQHLSLVFVIGEKMGLPRDADIATMATVLHGFHQLRYNVTNQYGIILNRVSKKFYGNENALCSIKDNFFKRFGYDTPRTCHFLIIPHDRDIEDKENRKLSSEWVLKCMGIHELLESYRPQNSWTTIWCFVQDTRRNILQGL